MKNTDLSTVAEIPQAALENAPLSLVILAALWRNPRLLVRVFIAGVLLATVIAFLIPSSYKSTVQLMSPGWQGGNSVLSAPFSPASITSAGGSLALGPLSSRSPAGPLLGIISSRTMQDNLINRFNLQHVYHVRTLAGARKVLSKRLSAAEDKPTGIISIVVTDHDPNRARDLAAACVDNLNQLVVLMDTSAAHQERLFLEQRIKEILSDLESSEQQLGHFSNRTGTVDESTQSKAMLDAVTNIQGQLIAAESELHGLQAAYSDQNVRVQQAKARVATLNAQLDKLVGTRGGGDSDAPGNQQYPSLRQLPLLGVTYADLYRRTRTLEVAYELLSRELEAAKLQEAAEIPSVKVLDPPVVAQQRSFPPRALIIVAGGLLSLLIGGAWAVSREVWIRIEDTNPWKVFIREFATSLPRLRLRP